MAPYRPRPAVPFSYVPLGALSPQLESGQEGYGYSKSDLEDSRYNVPYTAKDRPDSMISEGDSMLAGKKGAIPRTASKTGGVKPKPFLRYSVPIFALSIQLSLLCFLYTFFLMTMCGPVALPPSLAVFAKQNQQLVLLIVSGIATMLAAVSTRLLSDSVRYALTLQLSGPKPVELFNMSAAVQLSTGAFVLYLKRWDWLIISTILVTAMGSQTASWTTLLTPKTIPVTATLHGFELDVSSDGFAQLMAANEDVVNPGLFSNSLNLVTQSGATAVSTQFWLPSILNFNQMSYVNSTGGTLPATWTPLPSTSTSATGTVIPPSLTFSDFSANVDTSKKVFPVHFSMNQQGFSPVIKCSSVPLTSTSQPSVSIASSTQGSAGLNVSVAMLTVGCTGQGYTTLSYNGSSTGAAGPTVVGAPVLTNAARDAVFSSSCAVSEGNNGSVHWDLIIVGSGRYSFMGTIICSVWPLTTFVDVNYQDSSSIFNSTIPSFVNNTRAWNQTNSRWIGQFVVDVFLQGVMGQGQTTRGSAMGDIIREFVGGIGNGQPDPSKVPSVLEAYIRGVMEFSVTLLRSAYSSADNGLFDNGASSIPQDMQVPINGTFYTQTVGWFQATSQASSILTLVAPTVVGLATIVIILMSAWRTLRPAWKRAPGRVEEKAVAGFDPGNLLHIISAAQAGGFAGVQFPEYDDDFEEWSGKVAVKLARIGEGAGFVVG